MSDFLKAQLDYICFVYGLGLAFFAVVMYALRRVDGRAMPWRWLCLFGLSHGVNEWLGVLKDSLGDSTTLSLTRLAFVVASYLCLIQFGRRAAAALGRKPLKPWILIPLAAAAGLGGFAGLSGLSAAARYALGLTGGLWAAWGLWQYRHKEHPRCRSLAIAAAALGLYAVGTGLIVPKASFWPACRLNTDTFLATFGVPIQLFRALLVCIFASAVWRYYELVRRTRFVSTAVGPMPSRGTWTIALVPLVLIVGWLATQVSGQEAEKDLRKDLLGATILATGAVDPAHAEALTGTPEDENSTSYQYLRIQFARMASATPNIRWLYTMKIGPQRRIYFAVDSIPVEAFGHSPPGEVYDDAPEGLIEVFEHGDPVVMGPYTDKWGTWMSGFAGIREPGTGKVLGLMGLDIEASHWTSSIAEERLEVILIVLLVAGLLFTFFLIQQRNSEIQQEQAAAIERVGRQQAAIAESAVSLGRVGGNVRAAAARITEAAARATRVERVSIWFGDPHKGEIVCASAFELSRQKHSHGEVLQIQQHSRYLQELASGRTIAAIDARNDPKTAELRDGYLAPKGIVSLLHAGVRLSGKLQGIICFEHVGKPRSWLPDEVRFAGEIADQAAQALANASLRETEERYRNLSDSLHLGIARISAQHEILMANAALAGMFHKSPDELAGTSCFRLFENRDRVCDHCPGIPAMASGKPHEAEFEAAGPDGQVASIRLQAVPTYGTDGKPTGFIEVVENITERKRAEVELEKHRHHLEEMVAEATANLAQANERLQREMADRARASARIAQLNALRERLIEKASLSEKLKAITEGMVGIFGADFARIWLIGLGDRCQSGCVYAEAGEGPNVCRYRDRCLHLRASSGRYTHLDGARHRRVPFGFSKIGRIAVGKEDNLLTNDVANDPHVADHEWAKRLGLVAFAGYRLLEGGGHPVGVLALFSKQAISVEEYALLEGLAHSTEQVIRNALAEEEIRSLNESLEKRVEKRTSELALANDALRKEIAERRDMEQALRSSRNRQRALLDGIPDIAWFKDEEGKYVAVNRPFAKACGHEPKDVIGKTDFDIWPSDLAARYVRDDQRVMKLGRSYRVEEPLEESDGQRLWIETVKTPVHDEAGVVIGTIGIARDMSARKKDQESLRLLRTAVDDAGDAVFMLDRFDHPMFLNIAAGSLLEYTLETMTESGWQSIFADRQVADEILLTVRRRDKWAREVDLISRTGRAFPAEVRANPVVGDGAELVGAMLFINDITNRRGTEEALATRLRYEGGLARCSKTLLSEESEAPGAALKLLLEASGASRLYVYENFDDPVDGLCMRHLWEACAPDVKTENDNPVLQHLPYRNGFGRWQEDLSQGRPVFGLVEHFPESERAILEPQDIRSILVLPIWVAHRWHGFIGFDDTKHPREWNREDVALLQTAAEMFGAFFDRKRGESERMKRKETEHERDHLREAIKAHDRVLGVVGHELRTPLAGIRAMAEFLLDERSKNAAESEVFLRSINDEAVRMAGTINDLVEVARLNSGTAKWNWSEVPLAEVCEQAMDSIRPLIDHSKVTLLSEVTPPHATMSGDAGGVRRLILNLLSNARRHTAQGQIKVQIEKSRQQDRDWVDLRISDTGEGMSADVAKRLGVAFALNSGVVGESHVKGSGLGLAICRGIVAAHGGKISVDTALGQGTAITVSMPADLPGPESAEKGQEIVCEVRS